MSFSYSGDPSASDLDEVRFLIQDTNAARVLLSDTEINYLIDKWTPLYASNVYVASKAAEAVAAKYTGEVTYSADGVSIDGSALQTKYNQLAATLRSAYDAEAFAADISVGGVLYGETLDPSIKPLSFGKGMHDNARAGDQDMGGTQYDVEFTGNDYVPIQGAPF